MGSIVNRGTKDRPRWHVTYKDEAGRWRMVNTKQPTNRWLASFWVEPEIVNLMRDDRQNVLHRSEEITGVCPVYIDGIEAATKRAVEIRAQLRAALRQSATLAP